MQECIFCKYIMSYDDINMIKEEKFKTFTIIYYKGTCPHCHKDSYWERKYKVF